jgi:hypothetical protein
MLSFRKAIGKMQDISRRWKNGFVCESHMVASEVCVLGNSYDKGKIVLKEGLITITKYLEGENLKESEKKEINRNTRNGLVDINF